MEFYELYKEYERRVSRALDEFVDGQEEKVREDIRKDFFDRVSRVESAAAMLVASADYDKFCSIMRRRSRRE